MKGQEFSDGVEEVCVENDQPLDESVTVMVINEESGLLMSISGFEIETDGDTGARTLWIKVQEF